MSTADTPFDIEALLAPIPGAAPTGADLRYVDGKTPYDKIKTARKLAADKQQGRSEGGAEDTRNTQERAAAARHDWQGVRTDAVDALTSTTKDLQIAVWLLEAETALDAFVGVAAGLELIRSMLERYWDALYPPIVQDDDEPLALRAGVLEWINTRLSILVKGIPLSSGSRRYTLADYELAEKRSNEDLAREGRPSKEAFAQAMSASNLPHLQQLDAQLAACLTQVGELQRVVDERFGREGIGLGEIRKTLEDCHFQVARALRAKAPKGGERTDGSSADGGAIAAGAAATGDELWDRAMQLVQQGQLEGLRIAQHHIVAAPSGRERFLRQLQLGELCIQAGMHAFAYPILDDLGKLIDERDLPTWEDPHVIRRAWEGLAGACRALGQLRPESVERERTALDRLSALDGGSANTPQPENAPSVES